MRRFFSRFLLVVLVLVAVLAVVRFAEGEGGDALVALGDGLEPEELRHRAFKVDAPLRLAIEAVGSFETDSTMGATMWIVHRDGGVRDSGTVVWQLSPSRAERRRGSLATAADTLLFEPGVYDAYFAAYGDPLVRPAEEGDGFFDRLANVLTRGGRAWHGDAERWRFLITAADPAERDRARRLGDEPPVPDGPGVVWTTGPVRSGEAREFLFEVTAPRAVRLRATGEIRDGRVRDGAALLRLVGADTVWAMNARNTAPAGGSAMNRRVDAVLQLEPGLYRAVYTTDGDHAYNDWAANPPFVPTDWGLLLTADAAAAPHVVALDPWARLPRIASFPCVGEDELLEDTFTLADTTHVLLAALGEIIGSTAYDYAVLLRDRPGRSPEEVWVMGHANTRHAGGASKNREAEAFLTLDPGTYTLRYTSDGSHDCADFNDDEPPHPDRWGATLFAVDPDFDPASVVHVEPPAAPGPPDVNGDALVQIARVPNDAEREAAFQLDRPTTLRIYAIGEITPGGSYDYGVITDEDSDIVWEMTRDNTRWAGGSKKNRVFDGTITLPPGAYTAYYETDGSHAYGDWDQPPPNDPEAWGITIWPEREDATERAIREAERAAAEAERVAREAERMARDAVPPPPPPPPPPGGNDGHD